jgi:hypothetical protein
MDDFKCFSYKFPNQRTWKKNTITSAFIILTILSMQQSLLHGHW